MLILTIRTDNPEAELGLFEDDKKIAYSTWHAHRELAETIHKNIEEFLRARQKSLEDIQGMVVFKGPGSFTGLRIGISVANALANSLKLPIIGNEEDDWIENGIRRLENNENQQLVLPKYGSPPHITTPTR